MRGAFGAELWGRPFQAPSRALYLGRTGFCEWRGCGVVGPPARVALRRLRGGRGAFTFCPEGSNANLRSVPGLSKQLSQGGDRRLALDGTAEPTRAQSWTRLGGARPLKGAPAATPASAVRVEWRALGAHAALALRLTLRCFLHTYCGVARRRGRPTRAQGRWGLSAPTGGAPRDVFLGGPGPARPLHGRTKPFRALTRPGR